MGAVAHERGRGDDGDGKNGGSGTGAATLGWFSRQEGEERERRRREGGWFTRMRGRKMLSRAFFFLSFPFLFFLNSKQK